jgi:cytochrome P450
VKIGRETAEYHFIMMNAWICCDKSEPKWPINALERALIASETVRSGCPIVALKQIPNAHRPTVLIVSCPLASQVLKQNETCGSDNQSNDPSDDEEERASGIPSCVLHKPKKISPLLKYALTNANGEVWSRQRPIVARALTVKRPREQATIHATKTAMEQIRSSISPHGIDVRELSLIIAARAMCAAVVGADKGKELEAPLKGLFLPSLLSNRGEQAKVSTNQLNQLIEEIVSVERPGSETFVQSLLQTEPSLIRPEIVSNAHSALLAGTQTISTTIAGALMHLAERPDLQSSSSFSGRAAVLETLRILPPVSSLPRVPTESELKLGGDGGHASTVRRGDMLLVDLLAMAHADDGDSSQCTWKWTLKGTEPKSSSSKNTRNSAAPWGMGKRKCPAGTLSVECVSSVLEELVESGLEWRLADPASNSVGSTGRHGWIQHVIYKPTVGYPLPLKVIFESSTTDSD